MQFTDKILVVFASANMGYYPATIVRLSRTFGFARPEEEGAQDVFIPGKFLQGAVRSWP